MEKAGCISFIKSQRLIHTKRKSSKAPSGKGKKNLKNGADYLITTRGPGSTGRASSFEHAGVEICCMVVSQVLPNPIGILRKQPRVVEFAMSPS